MTNEYISLKSLDCLQLLKLKLGYMCTIIFEERFIQNVKIYIQQISIAVTCSKWLK